MRKISMFVLAACLLASCRPAPREAASTGFLRTDGRHIVNGQGEFVLLKGIGLGGWMLQEPYMLKLSGVAPAQYDIRNRITVLTGKERCEEFYDAWLANMVTRRDIDSLKEWGFNSVRLAMHYNLFTPPVEAEPVTGEITWLERGFAMTDSLLDWCAANEIYLILDLHAAPGGQGNDIPIADVDITKPKLWESELNRAKTVELWKRLAERYRDESWVGGYDLINETNYPLPGNKALYDLLREITGVIRAVDPNHIIFIEGNHFATDFEGLTPPWDDNMVYSFHKYWNPTTVETIQKYLDIRSGHNVPLWMGESGENNNEWYRSAVALFEADSIGWAWWTLKKLDSESGIMSVTIPAGYQEIIDYWKGTAPAPSPDAAHQALMELAENVRIENCRVNYRVLGALFGR
ncbi:MAG: cellulase family glycosylhydrolase [Bacteroidales bacterium]|nr:cellulase family glycosylhydrolase [Bacteroidales bacterium]